MSQVSRQQAVNAEQLAQLEATATAHGWSARHYQDSIQAGHVFYGLDQQALGCAVVMPLLDEAELLNIFIATGQQGQGLGFTLLTGLMQDLKQHGCTKLFLEVRASNLPARKLYNRCGFQETGMRKNYYRCANGEREHAILMEAVL
ncbi:ribosomal protein S18-alanine N-acetyltransferase [Aquitalea sp. ASV11]|uniref:ribosomal protein S18-alanine N-acetyltransferase n=1 Tax=Aquitalea sp. ASV11 TaxID=2795103 RepID=UPI0018ED0D6C|nr:ribosomal protein S18-alanine N-acetyltransferase [Aquitalea sp. ASV11]